MFITATLLSLVMLTLIAALPSPVRVTLAVDRGVRLELRFALFKLTLYNLTQKKNKGRSSPALAKKIAIRIRELLRVSEVTLEELHVPSLARESLSPASFISPYGFHIGISAAVAYLRANTLKLNIRDNAVILIPDSEGGFSLRLSARVRLFYLLRGAGYMLADKRKTEKSEEFRNVRN